MKSLPWMSWKTFLPVSIHVAPFIHTLTSPPKLISRGKYALITIYGGFDFAATKDYSVCRPSLHPKEGRLSQCAQVVIRLNILFFYASNVMISSWICPVNQGSLHSPPQKSTFDPFFLLKSCILHRWAPILNLVWTSELFGLTLLMTLLSLTGISTGLLHMRIITYGDNIHVVSLQTNSELIVSIGLKVAPHTLTAHLCICFLASVSFDFDFLELEKWERARGGRGQWSIQREKQQPEDKLTSNSTIFTSQTTSTRDLGPVPAYKPYW